MKERMCIVSRKTLPSDALIRFVVGPEDVLVPDIKGKLPGRGCWVSADKSLLMKAVERKAFSRALEQKVHIDDNLIELVEHLLRQTALGMIGLAKKAGQLTTGAAKVDDAVRKGQAIATLHATDAAADGIRKIDNARTFFSKMAEEQIIPSYQLFSSDQIATALGEGTYIHAAVLAGKAGDSVLKRLNVLHHYLNNEMGQTSS